MGMIANDHICTCLGDLWTQKSLGLIESIGEFRAPVHADNYRICLTAGLPDVLQQHL